MAEYVIRIKTKAAQSNDTSLETLLKQIVSMGGTIIDSGIKSALIGYDGTIEDLYKALNHEPQKLLICPLTEYQLPDTKKSIKG